MSLISLCRLMNRLTRLQGDIFTSVRSCYPVSRRRRASRRIIGCSPRLEALEDRCVPTAFVVSNTLDAGAGSLRQSILDANANPVPTVIGFNIPAHRLQTLFVGRTTGLPLP